MVCAHLPPGVSTMPLLASSSYLSLSADGNDRYSFDAVRMMLKTTISIFLEEKSIVHSRVAVSMHGL